MKSYKIICLDRGGKLHSVATIQTTPRKAKEAGKRFAKALGMKFHDTEVVV